MERSKVDGGRVGPSSVEKPQPLSDSSCRVVEAAVETVVAADEMVPRAESRLQSVRVVEVDAETECQGECSMPGRP